MKKFGGLAASAMLAFAALAVTVPAHAQGAKQVVTAIDVKSVGSGYRSSKIVGSDIVNDAGDTIGSIDDLIITKEQRALFAVISVGGYLGMGDKLIAMRYEDLRPTADNNGFVASGVTKEGLKSLPVFEYATN